MNPESFRHPGLTKTRILDALKKGALFLSIYTHLVPMAAEEHIQIIRQGVNVWNECRQKNPELIPDLHGADLIQANLSGAKLSGANLDRAKLKGAKFRGTLLLGADLGGADLIMAKLPMPDLSGAKLIGAQLGGERLSYMDLRGAGGPQRSPIDTPHG